MFSTPFDFLLLNPIFQYQQLRLQILKSNIMKRVSFFMVAVIAITFASCTKEIASENVPATSQTDDATAAVATVGANGKMSLSSTKSNYGALIDASAVSDFYTFETGVAASLGLSCLREGLIVPSSHKVKMLSSSYNILLNFSSTGPKPMKFRTDLTQYQTDLRSTIAAMSGTPKIAVIENEESNKSYYNGSATDYANQLRTAIGVMHSYGIQVANGGLTSTGLCYLTWQDYMNRGMTAQANDYKKRMKVGINKEPTKERAAFEQVLIDSFVKMDLDYVNFHWYSSSSADAQGLGETIDYLQRATGKKVITNEMGQYDQDPATLTASVDMCSSYKLPYILWYSGQIGDRSFPLSYNTGLLTTSGVAYQSYIVSH